MASSEEGGPLVVLELSAAAGEETVAWLTARIGGPAPAGADLRVTTVRRPAEGEGGAGALLLVGASSDRLERGAEELGLLREGVEGDWKPFSVSGRHALAPLSPAEGLYVLKRALDSLEAEGEAEAEARPGAPPLPPGRPLLSALAAAGLLRQLYPLHDRRELAGVWRGGRHLVGQPVGPLRDYFGESVALCFGFLGYFSRGLALRALLEASLYAAGIGARDDGLGGALSAAYNVAWVTAFPKAWGRQSSSLAFKWGTLRPPGPGPGRPGLGLPPAADTLGVSERQRALKVLGASAPFVALSLYVSCLLGQTFLYLEQKAEAASEAGAAGSGGLARHAPLLGYCLALEVLNKAYLWLAAALTDWEDHGSSGARQRHLLAKVLAFYVVNNFGLLYYLAFWRRDPGLASRTLSAQLVVHQAFGQTLGGLLHYWAVAAKRNRLRGRLRGDAGDANDANGDVRRRIEEEAALSPSQDALMKDYLEVFLLFGYANLFSSLSPLASGLCLFQSLAGLRLEGVKFGSLLRRPFPEPSADIGVWQVAFEQLSSLAIVTNCALVGSSAPLRALAGLPEPQYFLAAVALEHGLLGVQRAVNSAVPGVPAHVAAGLERMERECGGRGGQGPCQPGPPPVPPTTSARETNTEYLDCLDACLARAFNQLNKNYRP